MIGYMRTFVLDVSGIIAVKYILLYNTQFHRDGSLNGALVVQTTAASGYWLISLSSIGKSEENTNLRVEFRSQY